MKMTIVQTVYPVILLAGIAKVDQVPQVLTIRVCINPNNIPLERQHHGFHITERKEMAIKHHLQRRVSDTLG